MSKKILLILIFFSFVTTISAQSVYLNRFGHIESEKSENDVEYFMVNNRYKLKFEDHKFYGNAIYEINSGYLTLTTIHENVPSQLRIYDNQGKEKYSQEFPKVININFSQNRKFAGFFEGENLIVIDCKSYEIKNIQPP